MDRELVQEATVGWNPFKESFISIKNLNCGDVEDTAQGVTHFKGTVCPHANSDGCCFKGTWCPYEHHIDQQLIRANPKMAVPEETLAVTCTYKLPLKKLILANAIFVGLVVNASSPEDFYIIPRTSVECLCKMRKGKLKEDPWKKLLKDVNGFYQKYDFKNATSYAVNQLVVVRLQSEGQRTQYWRAVITGAVMLEDDEVPFISCLLLDIGLSMKVKMTNISPMSKLFCSTPPLAYKCFVYGISPMFIRYSDVVLKTFRELVEGKQVLVCAKLPYYPEESGCGVIEPEPCQVEIRFYDAKSKRYVNIKDELIKTGRVLTWNAVLDRPNRWLNMTDGDVDVLLDTNYDGNSRRQREVVETECLHRFWRKIWSGVVANEIRTTSPSDSGISSRIEGSFQ
ncbi:unnamed protein product [Allacma fusca]|uniref:Tudor domain-containing protein n=1 Tax=Allacma fusca TaxID=39272 RepID=A0A8J2K2A3_9HEXA|nr:unnamed protein product [Allacma fusca]